MRLLDLFCGAGGAAVGYAQAGFEVLGVDIEEQPHYPYPFVQMDALEYALMNGSGFDVIHASPPCQAWSAATPTWARAGHLKGIAQTRQVLSWLQRPYVIENVYGARGELRKPVLLCGSMVGLPIERHRLFETSPVLDVKMPTCDHFSGPCFVFDHQSRRGPSEALYRDLMECNWMTAHEAREAIPPAYTEFIGTHLRRQLR